MIVTEELPKKQRRLFSLLLQLTAIVYLWQIAFLLLNGERPALMTIIFHRVFVVPAYVWFEVAGFWLLQFMLYFIFVLFVWGTTRLIAKLFTMSWERTWWLGLWLWWLGLFALYFINEIFYPHSLLGFLFFSMFSFPMAEVTLTILLLIIFSATLLGVYSAFRFYYKRLWFWLCIAMFAILISFDLIYPKILTSGAVQVGHYKQPNVFIIGIDALRPDRVHFYGYSKPQTPNIDRFLKQSTRFRYSLSVLARTSPSWVSLLTGQYPIHNGVRFNLVPQQNLKLQESLGWVLKRHGYKTIFSTDGRRFDFIDQDFGFDKILGASGTVTNFLMDLVDNSPATNLVSNTAIGELLFPDLYGNRDVAITYHPGAFLNLVKEQMPKNIHQPIFLAIHFTLPHFPYYWGSEDSLLQMTPSKVYDDAVNRADEQFKDFMDYLKKQGLLNNAIVILISDHGEALALPGDRMISQAKFVRGKNSATGLFKTLNALNQGRMRLSESAGHGTDVLSDSQYNTMLAFRYYGQKYSNKAVTINKMVSLIDIKPTLLEILGIPAKDYDGISLLPYLQGIKDPFEHNMIFTEIGFTPTALKSSNISVQNAVYQSADLFAIQPKTHRIILKASAAKKLLKTKQRAVYYKNWVLALYPGKKDILFPVLVNRSTGQWTDDLSTPFAIHSPAEKLMKAIKQFYGKEVTDYLP